MIRNRTKYLSMLISLAVSASMLAACGTRAAAGGKTISGSLEPQETASSVMQSGSETSSAVQSESGASSAIEDVVTDSGAVSSISVESSSVEQAAEENRFNNRTDLADGDYTPDTFSWSGGSGRVEISCTGISVKNGRSYADIRFSSTHYIYVRAGGLKINGSGAFRIPVSLNQNNTVIGCTTAMSTPHEITYTMYFGVKEAGSADSGTESSGLSAQYNSLDDTAPKIPGLEYQSGITPQHASLFRIFRYDQGVDLVEVTLRDSASGSNLYDNPVVKYLIAPKDAELMAGIEKEAVVIRKPAKNVFLASEGAEKLLQNENLTSAFDKTDAGSY
ncbi:MAG: hypothetical protein SPE66_05215, partial [Bilifractor sp.]|nr:hypothetical protein [Bilifractor sp.]